MKHSIYSGILLVVFLLGYIPAGSHAALYDIAWTGNNGYSMTGQFSILDSATGIVDERYVESLEIEGFGPQGSVGSWSLNEARQSGQTSDFNFNFDTNTQQFLTGGKSLEDSNGQFWSNPLSTNDFGFVSGNMQALVIGGSLLNDSSRFIWSENTALRGTSTLTATSIANPVPSSLLLFASGLIGLIAFRNFRPRGANTNA